MQNPRASSPRSHMDHALRYKWRLCTSSRSFPSAKHVRSREHMLAHCPARYRAIRLAKKARGLSHLPQATGHQPRAGRLVGHVVAARDEGRLGAATSRSLSVLAICESESRGSASRGGATGHAGASSMFEHDRQRERDNKQARERYVSSSDVHGRWIALWRESVNGAISSADACGPGKHSSAVEREIVT